MADVVLGGNRTHLAAMPVAYTSSQCPSLRGFRLRAAFGSPVRNDVKGRDAIRCVRLSPLTPTLHAVIPDGRAALGAAEPEPTRRLEPLPPQRAGTR
ncbi:hypothetical protein GCM10017083_12710 [Thalassobaculum fulvum]|uniref:Uncharacterized protein n=1 Tax=Thalassobaculum fulvum TaxID=1633335 RepID=A0A918XPL8_9PROT|nr:hypothetical protein GCM10017083_12710 [Thalassobaculum fulvum]